MTFVITALVVYFVFVVPMRKLLEATTRRKAPVTADPTELDLLAQIRDSLRDGATVNPVRDRTDLEGR